MRRALFASLFAVLLLPAAAQAGGWATAGLSNTPDGDDQWNTQIILMQHGRTPLDGVKPAIIISDAKGVDTRFDAKPSGKPGVYDVAVTFPAKGKYTYRVDDGFGNAFPHEFAPVTIGDVAPASAPAPVRPADDGAPLLPWILAGVAVVLASGGLVMLRRRRGGADGMLPA